MRKNVFVYKTVIPFRRIAAAVLLLTGLAVIACGKSASGNLDGNSNPQPAIDERFSGTWNGSVQGDTAHFTGDPAIQLVLMHQDTLVSGTLATSDGAFDTVAFSNGRVAGDSIFIEVIQSAIYRGARVTFSGRLANSTIAGRWYHVRIHQGEWSAGRTGD